MLAPPNNSMELSSGFASALPDSAPLRPTAARRSLRLLRPWGVQLISRPLGGYKGATLYVKGRIANGGQMDNWDFRLVDYWDQTASAINRSTLRLSKLSEPER